MLSALCVAYFYSLDRMFFSSAHFSPIFRLLLIRYDSKAAWLSFLVCVLAALWNRPAPILRGVEILGSRPVSLASASAVLCALGALVVYRNVSLSMDEYAAVFQSKIFASGHFYARLPQQLVDWLIVSGFNGSFLIASRETGHAIAAYWPGFALLLAAFQFFTIPWACNAALSGLAVFLIGWITREIAQDRRAAGWAMLFALASGAFIAQGISYYSMQAHLAVNLLFVALLLRPSRARALAAGLAGSFALILHNPVPHALFALPWIAATALRRELRPNLLPLFLGYLPGVALGVSWLVFRSEIASGGHDIAAFKDAAAGVFAWPDTSMLNMRVAALAKMWIWALPCLFVFALLGSLRMRDNLWVRLLAQSALLTFAAYLFVRFDQGHGWGYRYFHSAWGVIPILAGLGVAATPGRQPRLESFAGAAAVLSLLILIPLQLSQIHEIISQHLAQLPPPQRPGNNVYFIHPRGGFYVADMVQIDPLLRDPDLYLVSRGSILDAQLVIQNWPAAARVAGTPAADQWYLGFKDQRPFAFTKIPSPPSVAGR